MRRIINSPFISVWAQFVIGTAHVFAASTDSSSNDGNLGFLGAILGVVLPTLLIIAIGGGIYVRFRRNKPSFTNSLPRRSTPKNWDISPPTSISSSPASVPPHGTIQFDRTRPLMEPDSPLEHDEQTIESLALRDLAQVLSLRKSNRIQEYYEAIAIIIKRYIAERYQIKSLDATTGQILSALPNGLTDSVTDHVGEILLSCDMIQFSRHRPSRSEQDRIYQTAREFIESQIAVAPMEIDEFEEPANENSEIYRHDGRRFQD